MRLLFDTNVVLDDLLARHPFVEEAQRLFGAVEERKIEGVLCATTLTTVFYIAAKAAGTRAAKNSVRRLIQLFDIALVDRSILDKALAMDSRDFEDSVLIASAWGAGCDSIVTRNVSDFKKAGITVYSPSEALSILEEGNFPPV